MRVYCEWREHPVWNSIWFHKGFSLAWDSSVLMWVTCAAFILAALKITMKGNYILLQVMLHGASLHQGVRGFTSSSSSSGVTGFTRSTAVRSFSFFFNTIGGGNDLLFYFLILKIVAVHEGVAAKRR